MSWKRVMPCSATNSRIFFWLVAVLGDSAGTRWSKMMAIFDGVPDLRLEARAREDLQELVDHERRVLVGHGEVHGGLDDLAGADRLRGPPRGPGSSRRRSFPWALLSQTTPLAAGPVDLLGRAAEPAQDLVGVAPRPGGGDVMPPGVFLNWAVRPNSLTAPMPGDVDRLQRPAVLDLGLAEGLLEAAGSPPTGRPGR